jgi:hypothetical protein
MIATLVVLAAICFLVAVALVAVVSTVRHVVGDERPVEIERPPLFDFIRAALALAAAALAILTGLTALADYSIESNPYAGSFFIVAGVLAAALALYPARGVWGRGRRFGVNSLGWIWLVLGFVSLPLFIMASACGCSEAFAHAPAPTPLGVDARSWMFLAVIFGPASLLLAGTALADRAYALRHRNLVGS